MIEAKVLLKGPFDTKSIKIIHNSISNRKIDPILEARVDRLWIEMFEKYKSEGKKIYDGESYRLDGYKIVEGELILEVSKIKFSKRLPLVKSLDILDKYSAKYYGNGLSVAGFLETADSKFIFGKRGDKSLANYSVDFIGGILDGVELSTGLDIVEKLVQEIEEETGVDREYVFGEKVLGLVLSPTTNIIIITSAKLRLTSFEVEEVFKKNSDEEMSELIFIEREKLAEYLRNLGGYKVVLEDFLSNL